MEKRWFVTGAGRGLGRAFVSAALARGDRVAATVRAPGVLHELSARYGDRLHVFTADVTDRMAIAQAVDEAWQTLGGVDVVVNNAGYGLFGAVEELSEEQLRRQLEVNLFGPFHVVKAALPHLRAQGQGHIVQISTVGGIAAYPNLGGYHASKWALEGLTESLAQEVKAFGIKVTLVEPGPFGTDWAGSSAAHATPLEHYEPLREASRQQGRALPPSMIGSPDAAATALLRLVDHPTPPLRVLFGTLPTLTIPPLYESRLAEWEEWRALSIEANGIPVASAPQAE